MADHGYLPRKIAEKLAIWAEAERGRFILLVPVWLGVGVSIYFSLCYEPGYLPGLIAAGGATILCLFTRVTWQRVLACWLALAGTGFIAAKLETERMQAPVLARALSIRTLSGEVEEAVTLPKGVKLLLRDVTIEKLPRQQTPHRISVTIKRETGEIRAGQHVSLRAGLYPPPEPSMPGAFDFNRYFYFRGIGAVGYGLAPVTVLRADKEAAMRIAQWRVDLSKRLYAVIPLPYGGLAAGLVTGDTGAISQDVYDTMKQAGLTHLLAVSGFNLVIVTGIVFFAVRFLLACIPFIALRYPIKRMAAGAAMIGGYLYLLLTGSPVSAERAFIMSSLLLVAVMIDRVPTPMRSLAIAAAAIMLIEPHNLLSAGFQLSFATTMALIAFYDVYRLELKNMLGARRILYYLFGAFLSALVAGLSTAPFIIYHFNQIASYTIIANMLAAPLVSFWIMPALLLGLLCMPLGWEAWPLTAAKWGLQALLAIADLVVKLPGALWHVPTPASWGLALIAIGLIWFCVWSTRLRWAGVPLLAAGLASSLLYTPPDILISADMKQVALRRDDGRLLQWRGTRENFQNRQWLDILGEDDLVPRRLLTAQDGCDDAGCSAYIGGKTVTFLTNRDTLWEECGESDVLIAAFFLDAKACDSALVIDERKLREQGAHVLYLKHGIRVETASSLQGLRPWSPAAWSR